MHDPPTKKARNHHAKMDRAVEEQARRKLRTRRRTGAPVWFGLGAFGLIGWSVATPTLLGALLGMWLDRHQPGRYSWTLALLLAGLVLGCLVASHWVARQHRDMHREEEAGDE